MLRSVCLSTCMCLSVYVCRSACPGAYLWNRWTDLHEILFADPLWRGSILLWWHCDTLCTSSFMDDVTFGRSGPYGASGVSTPGRSLMSMNVLFLFKRGVENARNENVRKENQQNARNGNCKERKCKEIRLAITLICNRRRLLNFIRCLGPFTYYITHQGWGVGSDFVILRYIRGGGLLGNCYITHVGCDL